MERYKTGSEVEIDVWNLLRNSTIKTVINGDVYRDHKRPKNSTKEDAVVIFTAGLSNQIQTGIVTILIYVPDLDIGGGVLEENGARTLAIEKYMAGWLVDLNQKSKYHFKLASTPLTNPEPEIKQHFVSVRLEFQILIY